MTAASTADCSASDGRTTTGPGTAASPEGRAILSHLPVRVAGQSLTDSSSKSHRVDARSEAFQAYLLVLMGVRASEDPSAPAEQQPFRSETELLRWWTQRACRPMGKGG